MYYMCLYVHVFTLASLVCMCLRIHTRFARMYVFAHSLRSCRMNTAWTVVGVVYASLFLNFFLVASFDSLGPRLTESHGLTHSQLSIIISIKSMLNMAMGPALALMSWRIPLLWMFSVCSVSIALAYAGIAISSTMTGFLISRALHGIGTSGLMVGGMSVLMKCVVRNVRGKYSSIAYSAAGHAPLVAPVLSGLMYAKLGQFWSFMIPAIVTLFVTIVSFCLLKRALAVPILHSAQSQVCSTNTIRKADMWPCVQRIFRNPISFIALAGIFCQGVSFGSCESTLPQILTDWTNPVTGEGLSVLTTSLLYSVGPLTFTLFAPLVGFLVDRFAHYKVLLFGLCMYAILFPWFQLLDNTLPGLTACIGIAFGITVFAEVSIYPLIAEIVEATNIPHADGIGYALNEMFIQGGYAVGNIIGRLLVDWNGTLAMGCFVSGLDTIVVLISIAILIKFAKTFAKNNAKNLTSTKGFEVSPVVV